MKSLIKAVLSIVMLVLVLRVLDFEALEKTFATIPLSVTVLAILGYSLSQVVNCSKWWIIARSGGIEIPFLLALRAMFVGMFANCFGFGTVGGDILRGVIASQGRPQKTAAIASVFADRALGLAVLSLIGVLATAFVGGHHMQPVFVYVLCAVSTLVFVGWLVGPFLVLRFVPKGAPFRNKVEQLMRVFPKKPGTIILVVAISAVFHLFQISLIYFICLQLGIVVRFASMLVSIPFVNIISTLPISWNGLGVRENAYIFFLYPEVFSKEQAVAVGAIWLLGITVSSLIGGFVAVWTGDFKLVFRKSASVEPDEAKLGSESSA